ncbi:hypothetical protein HAX54_037264, partial [Datura stramonium]|nr:hypothetical protein [Datura stramonium]
MVATSVTPPGYGSQVLTGRGTSKDGASNSNKAHSKFYTLVGLQDPKASANIVT